MIIVVKVLMSYNVAKVFMSVLSDHLIDLDGKIASETESPHTFPTSELTISVTFWKQTIQHARQLHAAIGQV